MLSRREFFGKKLFHSSPKKFSPRGKILPPAEILGKRTILFLKGKKASSKSVEAERKRDNWGVNPAKRSRGAARNGKRRKGT